jgi:hypothetical protein
MFLVSGAKHPMENVDSKKALSSTAPLTHRSGGKRVARFIGYAIRHLLLREYRLDSVRSRPTNSGQALVESAAKCTNGASPARTAADRAVTELVSEVLNEEWQRPQIDGGVATR